MRLYKTFLDEEYDVISYVIPEDIEKIYSIRTGETYDISIESINEYIELFGNITSFLETPSEGITSVMYLDIDYKYDIAWENDLYIHVSEQILSSFKENIANTFDISGLDTIFIGESTYLSHNKYNGGVWSSSNEDIIKIDQFSGLITGRKIGISIITYQVDTGYGILTCTKKVKVVDYDAY